MTQKQFPSTTGGMTPSPNPALATVAVTASGFNPDTQSVAGEEDPGASLDLSGCSPSRLSVATASVPCGRVNPGDEAPEGLSATGKATVGTGRA